MKSIIIYGSHYGTTKKYADELSKRTNIQSISLFVIWFAVFIWFFVESII